MKQTKKINFVLCLTNNRFNGVSSDRGIQCIVDIYIAKIVPEAILF